MDKFLYLVSEGIKNFWRHKMAAFTAVFSLVLSLMFIGILIVAGDNTHKILQYFRAKYKIEVFFNNDLSLNRALDVFNEILLIDGIEEGTCNCVESF